MKEKVHICGGHKAIAKIMLVLQLKFCNPDKLYSYHHKIQRDKSHIYSFFLIAVGNICLSGIILSGMEYSKNPYPRTGFQYLSLNQSSSFDSCYLLLETVLQAIMQ